MTESEINQLKFPIGVFCKPEVIQQDTIQKWINTIESFPVLLKQRTDGITKDTLNWKYRPGGWSIKQVVHHCADSHMNSFIRFKLALTEAQPVIRPYFEDRWAELDDGTADDIEASVQLLEALHTKWCRLLRSLTNEQRLRGFIHPEHGTEVSLGENIGIYAWHCMHHMAHIDQALKAKGKYN